MNVRSSRSERRGRTDVMAFNPGDRRELARSMSGNFSGVYLTMLSIIQGVAFTDLANIAFSERERFSAANWIEVATMLWTLIYVWNHFMGDALMAQWIPDLEDALLLFGTGTLELVGNHAIVWNHSLWLVTLGTMFAGWGIAALFIRRQEEAVVREPVLLAMLRGRTRPLFAINVGGGGLLCALAAVPAIPAAVSAAATLCISLAIGGYSSVFWRGVHRYASTGRVPAWTIADDGR